MIMILIVVVALIYEIFSEVVINAPFDYNPRDE
ncbi:hypothetical protein cce_2960 [Crocosphaera subtropica ATCC 51142]|uniref:Uncharacterized protein n=1 Tax=Crocosphaera subtropica (strain ATCC 51142 / BH68) TaxID=43989 RepID=B1WVX5_CROS5|nr:hypothetical protein cce_2960 [Crocosphaera subtropica ATCC 51142]